MTRFTALEIFTNPYDLEILIVQEKGGGKYSVLISRGPGHNFKIMLSSQPFAEKLEDAVQSVKEILELILQIVPKDLENQGSVTSQYLNLDGETIDPSKVLNSRLIGRILNELRQNRVASTYKMPAITN